MYLILSVSLYILALDIVTGGNQLTVIPKRLKMAPMVFLLGTQYSAFELGGVSSPNDSTALMMSSGSSEDGLNLVIKFLILWRVSLTLNVTINPTYISKAQTDTLTDRH